MRTLQQTLDEIKKNNEKAKEKGKVDVDALALYDLLSKENPKSERVYYRDEDVWLDGYTFIRCRFDNCKLHVKSGDFEFDHCIVGENTSIMWYDPSIKVVRLFLNAYAPLSGSMKNWGAQYHEDGTLSIRNR